MAISLGTDQFPWTRVIPTTSTLALPGPGSRNQSTGLIVGDIDLTGKQANSFALRCYGKNAANKTNGRASLQLIGLSKPTGGGPAEFLGEYMGRLVVELGATGSNTGVFTTVGDPFKFAHKIFVLDDATNKPPGFRIVGDEDDAWAEIIFDSMGYSRFAVQMTNIDPDPAAPNPTAQIGYLWRPT